MERKFLHNKEKFSALTRKKIPLRLLETDNTK